MSRGDDPLRSRFASLPPSTALSIYPPIHYSVNWCTKIVLDCSTLQRFLRLEVSWVVTRYFPGGFQGWRYG
jgi:hypothetical protein